MRSREESRGEWTTVAEVQPDSTGSFAVGVKTLRRTTYQAIQFDCDLMSERVQVTDPYSVSLARNSRRSQIVDLASPDLKPTGWDTLVKPPLAAPEDITLYELHVRDFSAHDLSVPERPELFVAGDLIAKTQDGKPLPGVAQLALQSGILAAQNVIRRIDGRPTLEFKYTGPTQVVITNIDLILVAGAPVP